MRTAPSTPSTQQVSTPHESQAAAPHADQGVQTPVQTPTTPSTQTQQIVHTPSSDTARADIPVTTQAAPQPTQTTGNTPLTGHAYTPSQFGAIHTLQSRSYDALYAALPKEYLEKSGVRTSGDIGTLSSTLSAAISNTSDNQSLSRRLADYLWMLSGGSKTETPAKQEQLPPQPQEAPQDRDSDDLEKARRRQKLSMELDTDWSNHLHTWMTHIDDSHLGDGQSLAYLNEQVSAWSAGLMHTQPAKFRVWLTSPARYAASTGLSGRAAGKHSIQTLPEGFTEKDYRRWIAIDALDLL